MNYIVLIISFIVGVFQVPELSFKKFTWKPWIIFSLSIVGLVLGIVSEVQQNTESKYLSNSGTLDGTTQNTDREEVPIGIGSSTLYIRSQDIPAYFGDIDLQIYRKYNKLFVNTSIRDSVGNLIASIHENDWQVNPNSSFDKNFDDNAVEVKDNKGNIVLKADFDGYRVNLSGIFYHKDGSGFAFLPATKAILEKDTLFDMERFVKSDKTDSAARKFSKEEIEEEMKHPSALITVIKKGDRIPDNYIEPIFKYPSKVYPGVRIEPR